MLSAAKFPHPQGKYAAADGSRYRVLCGQSILLPPDSPVAVVQVESLAAFLAAEGLTLVAATPGPVPTLTARQLRLWIINDGMTLAAVESALNAISDPTAQARARVEWEYASVYHHDHPLVLQIGAALGLSTSQIDTAFRVAANL